MEAFGTIIIAFVTIVLIIEAKQHRVDHTATARLRSK
jgi:hypothetical protein